MKRQSAKQKRRSIRLGLRRRKIALRRRNFRYAPDLRYKIEFPKVMSLESNFKATIQPIEELKKLGLSAHRKPVVLELDWHQVTSVSTASLLILNSEIDRILAQRHTSVRFVVMRLDRCSDTVKRQLERLGFFDLLEMEIKFDWPEYADGESWTLLPMIACDRLMPERVQRIRVRLESVAQFFNQGSQVYEAMIEATDNAVRHAYALPDQLLYPPASMASWWATAEYSEAEEMVRVLVFDQGTGIAATLPRWRNWEQTLGFLRNVLGDELAVNDDARMIEAALEVSRTSLGKETGHGQGLSDILSPVREFGQGTVRILSGRGSILYNASGEVVRKSLPTHVGGTLIEWCLPVPNPE